MVAGPARGRTRRATTVRALLPCLALSALGGTLVHAQTLTPDMLRPVRGGLVAPQDSPLRPTPGQTAQGRARSHERSAAVQPRYAGAVACRQDSDLWPSRRQRRFRVRLRLAQPQAQEAEILSRPGQAEAAARARHARAGDGAKSDDGAKPERPCAPVGAAVGVRQQDADPAGDGRHGGRPARAQAPQGR